MTDTSGTPISRPLSEQFTRLPVDIQSRMFRVLDVVIGMSQDEKKHTNTLLSRAGTALVALDADAELARDLLQAVSHLVAYSHMAANGSMPREGLLQSIRASLVEQEDEPDG